jgi:hypothetical protein
MIFITIIIYYEKTKNLPRNVSGVNINQIKKVGQALSNLEEE